jgi:hypothetical protein
MASLRISDAAGGWLWCLVVFLVAVPALASPVLVTPMPEGAHLSRPVLTLLVAVLGIPREWAGVATVVAVLGARRYASWWGQEMIVSSILICAWAAAGSTAARMVLF